MSAETGIPEDSNADLRACDVPSEAADWDEISTFALTYDGYAHEDCAEIANARRHDSLDDLRTCLFFEQRRWRHFGETPDDETMLYLREVVEKIRRYVDEANELARGLGV